MYHENTRDIGKAWAYASGWRAKNLPTAGELAQYVVKYPNSPCMWGGNGQRGKAKFRFADWLGLDFDEGMTLERGLEVFGPYMHVIGTTRNHQRWKGDKPPCDRFRVFLRFGVRCESADDYEATAASLIEEYGADNACKDAARMFWPCVEIVSTSYSGKIIHAVHDESVKKKAEAIERRNKKVSSQYAPTKTIPGKTKLLLDFGHSKFDSRTVACYAAARDLMRVGFSFDEALQIIWNSAIPLDSSDKCFKDVKKAVTNAYSKPL